MYLHPKEHGHSDDPQFCCTPCVWTLGCERGLFYVQQHRDPPKNRGTGQTPTLHRTTMALTMQPCGLSQDNLILIHTTAQKQLAHQREVGGGRWGNDPLMGFTRSAWRDNSHDDQMGQHLHSRCSSSPFNFIPCAHWGEVGDTPGTLDQRTIPIHTHTTSWNWRVGKRPHVHDFGKGEEVELSREKWHSHVNKPMIKLPPALRTFIPSPPEPTINDKHHARRSW